jgi:TatD DNase family protein
MFELIDSHCHLDFEAFDGDREKVVERARKKGIGDIIIPGVKRRGWKQIRTLCNSSTQLHACYGLHPYLAGEHTDDDIVQLKQWLQDNPCVAVGECGLDYRKDQADRHIQMKFFRAQLDIAQAVGKPVAIHSVHATGDVINTIRNYPGLRGMIHSYSGSYEQARQLLDLGFYISLGGAITYKRASKLRTTAARMPLTSILIETDAPDQPDAAHHGERNEPAYLVNVLKCLGELRDEPVEEIAAQTTRNAQALFGI